jgi:hypothetical protein
MPTAETIPNRLNAEQIASKNAREGLAWRLNGTLPRAVADALPTMLHADATGAPLSVKEREYLDRARELEEAQAALDAEREEAVHARIHADTLRNRVAELETAVAHEVTAVKEIEASLNNENLANFFLGRKAVLPLWNNESRVEVGRWIAGAHAVLALMKAHIVPRMERELADAKRDLAAHMKENFPAA